MSSGLMEVIDHTGDTRIIWDRDNPAEVENAKRTFSDLRKKGYIAYSVSGKSGEKGKVINEFDEDAERLILAPAVAGG